MAADYATAAALQRALTLHYKYGDRHNLLRREACFASFCAEGDLLSQWRAYGRDGQGYAIGFSADALSDAGKPHNFRLMPAIYDRAEQRQILKGLFEEAANVISSPDRLSEYYRARGGTDAEGSSRPRQLQGHDLDMFWARLIHQAVKIALTFKHGGFNEEQEWRLVSEYPLRRAWWFIAAERGVIPYREIEFPESCIRELWLGPALDQDLNEKMLDLFIEHGCKAKPAIHRSAIPFRGL